MGTKERTVAVTESKQRVWEELGAYMETKVLLENQEESWEPSMLGLYNNI